MKMQEHARRKLARISARNLWLVNIHWPKGDRVNELLETKDDRVNELLETKDDRVNELLETKGDRVNKLFKTTGDRVNALGNQLIFPLILFTQSFCKLALAQRQIYPISKKTFTLLHCFLFKKNSSTMIK